MQSMQIQVYVHDEEVREPLERYVHQRLEESLQYVADRLTRVEVHLRETNGHGKASGKRCTLEARPRGLDPLAVEHDSSDYVESVKQASGKLRRLLQSTFDRLGDRSKKA